MDVRSLSSLAVHSKLLELPRAGKFDHCFVNMDFSVSFPDSTLRRVESRSERERILTDEFLLLPRVHFEVSFFTKIVP